LASINRIDEEILEKKSKENKEDKKKRNLKNMLRFLWNKIIQKRSKI